ncbi:MAG TPA: Fur family transcriptional regulator [Candidatus Saccharimonadales bacterium]|nr:Fur family transcriptional regulator [Candidatus Saccharimonadales bacterium]
MSSDITTVLSKNNLRVTKARLMVFRTLQHTDRPLSHAEVAQSTPEVDRVSVYRVIEIFIKIGIVTSVAYGWKQRYELAAPFRPHHHHFVCTRCHNVTEIQSNKLEKIIHLLADAQGFKATGHTFEITGICQHCQTA